MRFHCNVNANPRGLVTGLGSNIPVTSAQVKRRDGADVELALHTGEQGAALPYKHADTFEMRFACKVKNDFRGSAIVLARTFAWRPSDQVYAAKPSFAGLALAAVFDGALGCDTFAEAHTLDASDIGRVLVIDSTTAVAFTVPVSIGEDEDEVWVIAADEAVTLTPGAGVTFSDPDTLSTTVASGTMVLLRRISGASWRIAEPGIGELEQVALMAEFTWRDLADPDNWTSTDTFEMIVRNDVIRGDEGQPQDEAASEIYLTQAEAAVGFVKANEAQSLTTDQKTQARANIGAIGDGVAITYEDQDPTAPQQAQARENIGAAAATALAAVASDLADLDTDHTTLDGVALKKTAQTLTGGEKTQVQTNLGVPAASALTALDGVVLKKTAQSLSDPEKLQARLNIGAAAAGGVFNSVRQAATWNAVGNGVTVALNGAGNSAVGTATTRNVQMVDAGHAIASYSGSVMTSTAHGGVNAQPVQFSGTTIASPLIAGTWYYLRDVAANTFAAAATPGGAAITLSGSISAMKVLLSTGPAWHHRRIGYVSAATAGQSSGTRHGLLQWAVSSELPLGFWTFNARFQVSDAAAVANARMFVGLASTAAVLPNGNPSSLANIIGVGSDTGDSTLRIMHNDGSGSATRIDLGSNFPCQTRTTDPYDLVLVLNDDLTVTYTVTNLRTGNLASGNLASDLPMALILLGPQLWRNNGSTAVAVGLDVMQWSLTTSK